MDAEFREKNLSEITSSHSDGVADSSTVMG